MSFWKYFVFWMRMALWMFVLKDLIANISRQYKLFTLLQRYRSQNKEFLWLYWEFYAVKYWQTFLQKIAIILEFKSFFGLWKSSRLNWEQMKFAEFFFSEESFRAYRIEFFYFLSHLLYVLCNFNECWKSLRKFFVFFSN